MSEKKPGESALNVMKGIDQPEQINRELVRNIKGRKTGVHNAEEYLDGILTGNRTILSKAITLVESSLPAHQQKAQQIIAKCLEFISERNAVHDKRNTEHSSIIPSPLTAHLSPVTHHPSPITIRIGITGVPGVGKSTFIEELGKHLTSRGHRLAVLAIDPSSSRSKGSILGDKTRMEELANDPDAFIRPSPSGGSLGGVARKTRETIILCEAAGFDVIFVETVGVGQSETAVHGMVDFFLLLMLAGAGDELQGIKRGIIEMADAILINKADGDNLQKAKLAKTEYSNALHLFPPPESGWIPVVETCSSRTGEGIDQVWSTIEEFCSFTKKNGFFDRRRIEQDRQVLFETIEASLKTSFFSRKEIAHQLKKMEAAVMDGKMNPYTAAQELLGKYFEGK
ncbi:MAG: methylmalonyl Co-A mutase-associated GTPase MeaB [Bacteroidetes bacterium]|nr:methylmalonyl Co-A mutase-associated GTPase MeaB [Bacteroidota bacterium]